MRAMIVDISFSYDIEIVPPRRRLPETRHIQGSVPVRVLVPDDGEFPVALRVVRDGRTEEYRWTDSRFYKAGRDFGTDGALLSWHSRDLGGARPEAVAGRLVSSTEDEKKAEVIAAWSGRIVHGSSVWSPAQEPVWIAKPRATMFGSLDLQVPSADPEPMLAQMYANPAFRADRKDEAERWLSGQGSERPCCSTDVEVLLPEALARPAADLRLASALRAMIKRANEELADLPRNTVARWLDFRDEHDGAEARRADPLAETVMQSHAAAAEAFADSLPSSEYPWLEETCLREALGLWRRLGSVSEPAQAIPAPGPR